MTGLIIQGFPHSINAGLPHDKEGSAVDFSLSEEQVLLRDSVEKYVGDNCGVERHRTLCAAQKGFDESTWQQFAELGWLSVPFTEAQGGFDGSVSDVVVVAEALGKGHLREPFLTTVVTCGGFLRLGGSEQQQSTHIPSIIDGAHQWAFAFAEDNNSYDLENIATSAEQQGEGYLLSGSKIAVLNGDAADFLVVSALTAGGVSVFIVDANQDSVKRQKFVSVDGSCGAHIAFDKVELGADQLLGELNNGVALMHAAIDNAIVCAGGEAVGAMQGLLEATVEYTKTREQFGQPISKFQALQHAMADMYLKIEETRSLLLNAAIAIDEDSDEAPSACAALKVKVAEAGRVVAQQAVQLHGGIGMTDELSVSHHYKRLMVLSKLYGDEAYYLQRFAGLTKRNAA
ncbi:MAG: alkylation response protein AidB-like acyl-CoA dehydrogenase [Halioglobus sp.]|jgi:alkylation response protein AidB-like acyl-CoA dehydrogenase